ncbi:hypothetical protein WBQ88_12430 [Sphingopyxis sp. CCNWLW253]|uniref:hypothetical protein n=1 Tax=unclassified Sphingopyxis TaxID=2614943 RepID=UPI003012DEF0
MRLNDFLSDISTVEIGEALSRTYDDIVRHYVSRNWKSAGLDAGHFVEACRRFLEYKLFGAATPISKALSNFSDAALAKYLSASGDEAYRILIPRLLWALYALRNKRSIGHLGAVPASEIDASILLNGAKWIISEIVRIESSLSQADTAALVRGIIARQEVIVWKDGPVTRVLDQSLEAREKALVLLAFTGDKSEDDLRIDVCYKNPTNFRKILKRLDESGLIFHSKELCCISPTGTAEAEKIARNFLDKS